MNAPFVVRRPKLTLDQVRAMIDLGAIEADAPLELIGGELVEMPADGPAHINWGSALGAWLYRSLDSEAFGIVPGMTLRLSQQDGPKPDWWVYPAELQPDAVRGEDVLLALEVSDSSLDRDLGWKADLYARFGVRDYWVVHTESRRVRVHRRPEPDGYGERFWRAADERVEALLLPDLALLIDDLPRVGRGRSV